jgi:2-keto-4-pentenoate hydratase
VAGNRVRRLAGLLIEARQSDRLVPEGEDAPRDVEEAYRIQDLVLEALCDGRRTSAWKAIPPRPGGAQLASPVPPGGLLRSPATLRAPNCGLVGVEAEIGFRLGPDLQAEEALVLIELCETRLAGWESSPTLWKLADFQSHCAFVLGSGTKAWHGIDFTAQTVEVFVNGARRARAVGGHPCGDPSRLLPWMIGHCANRGGLQPGDVVATGSWVGIVPVAAKDDVLVRFHGIGEARLKLG